MDAREKKILFLTSAVHALVHMQMLIFAAVNIEMAADLQVSIQTIGLVGTIGYFLFGLGALPAGILIDTFGARRVLALCTGLMGLANLLLAFTNSSAVAITGLALLGLGGSLYHPAGLGLISRNVRETGHALGIHGTIGNFGVASGPLIAGIVASSFGWRAAYIWPAAVMLAFMVVYLFVRFGDVVEEERSSGKANTDTRFGPGLFRLMVLVIILQMLSGFIYRASNTFMPAYTGTALTGLFAGLDPTARGGILAGIILIAGSIGQYVAGRLTRKHAMEPLQVLASVVAVPLLLGFGLLRGIPMLLTGMAFSFVFYGLQPLGNALVARYSPPGVRGRSYGVSFFLNFGLGAFGSWFAGAIADAYGFNVIYVVLSGIALASVCVAWLIHHLANKRKPNKAYEQPESLRLQK